MVKPNINYTLHHNLCTSCGICEGVCPSGAITTIVNNGRFQPQINNTLCKNQKGCHRCYDACPGIGIDIPKLASERFFGTDNSEEMLVGRYLKCYSAYSNNDDLRYLAASGGTISQFLIWLLETGIIDGAIVTKFDKDAPFKVKSYIATSSQEIILAKSSKYGPVSMGAVVKDIRKSDGKRFVVVGLPCHIHGFIKLEAIDRKLKEKIVGHFSLFCSGSQTFNYTEYIFQQCNIKIDQVNYLSYREGEPTCMAVKGERFEFTKLYQAYNRPLKSTFYPRRCLLCVDFQGELADIAFGDIASKPDDDFGNGMNAVIVRSKKWLELFEQAAKKGAISVNEITLERLNYKRYMVDVKKEQNVSYIAFLRKIGKTVPEYGYEYNANISLKKIIAFMVKRFKQYIGEHRFFWFLLPKIK